MKTTTQSSAAFAHVAKLIEGIPIGMLTTIESDGSLASRPMAALEMDEQGALWFFTDWRSSKVEHLAAVNLGFSDMNHGTYVSLSGRGEIHTDFGRIRHLWTTFTKPWFPDGPDSPHLAVLKFIPQAADYWDAPNSKMVRVLGALASVVAGRPIGMGVQGSYTGLSPIGPISGIT